MFSSFSFLTNLLVTLCSYSISTLTSVPRRKGLVLFLRTTDLANRASQNLAVIPPEDLT